MTDKFNSRYSLAGSLTSAKYDAALIREISGFALKQIIDIPDRRVKKPAAQKSMTLNFYMSYIL